MKKLYVLIRKDLNPSYQAVQAGHAVAEWLLQHGQVTDWKNGTLVYLGVDNEEALEHWAQKLDSKHMEWTEFREPDIEDQRTAIACLHDGKVFKNLRLI